MPLTERAAAAAATAAALLGLLTPSLSPAGPALPLPRRGPAFNSGRLWLSVWVSRFSCALWPPPPLHLGVVCRWLLCHQSFWCCLAPEQAESKHSTLWLKGHLSGGGNLDFSLPKSINRGGLLSRAAAQCNGNAPSDRETAGPNPAPSFPAAAGSAQ